MGYFLRQEKKKKGTYLQMYETYWNKSIGQARTRNIETFGYAEDLVSDEIPDPIAYYKEVVRKREQERLASLKEDTRPRAFRETVEKNIGHFLVSSLIDELGVKKDVDFLASVTQFRFSVYDMIKQLIASRIVSPCSKSKTVSSVFPLLYGSKEISEDQVYDGLAFIGENYRKYIELFNHQYERHFKRDFSTAYFDCTNFYFEIDLPREDLQKGPSKENRHEPIIGQALLLDSDLVPLGMQMYPGNESEKPYIRKLIEEMKQRYHVSGRTVQVADKGLNCARNIYAAAKESSDGYIFSKATRGKSLNATEKTWLLLENDRNKFTDHFDANGKLLYRLKSCIDDFEYEFIQSDPETGKTESVVFTVREKRVVSYNPDLAQKQRAEILKMAEKVSNCVTYKKMAREELGDSAKYLKITNEDQKGHKIKPVMELDQAVLEEDLKYAGYNLLVTSETEMSAEEIYRAYHGLWKIEESFRITKSYLDARPVYVQKKETIYGHFLICYLSLFLLRVLEIKCFDNKVNAYDLIDFIRDFRAAKRDEHTYLNLSRNQKVNEKIKAVTGLSILDALYLTEDEIKHLFSRTILINS